MAEAVLHELFDTILGPKLSYTDRVRKFVAKCRSIRFTWILRSFEQNVAQVNLHGPSSKIFGGKCGSSRFTWTV